MSLAEIRYATPSDIPKLNTLIELHVQLETQRDTSATIPQHPRSLESLTQLLFGVEPKVHCWVVEVDGEVMGYATYAIQFSTWHSQKYMYLDCLFLDETIRGQGIGKEVMSRIASVAEQLNCQFVEWQTPAWNQNAIQFYSQLSATARTKSRFHLELKNNETANESADSKVILEPTTHGQPFVPRHTKMVGVKSCLGWQLKVYSISASACGVESQVIAAAMRFVKANVRWPAEQAISNGFVIVHQGEQAVWLLVHLWMQDILRQFVFVAPLNAPTEFQVSPMDGFNACVWELEVTQHERNAWVKHVLAKPAKPNVAGYLSDALGVAGPPTCPVQ